MKYIEKPLALIQSGMDPSETLHPFSVSSLSKRPHRTTTTTTANSACGGGGGGNAPTGSAGAGGGRH